MPNHYQPHEPDDGHGPDANTAPAPPAVSIHLHGLHIQIDRFGPLPQWLVILLTALLGSTGLAGIWFMR
jgi:hypothetical protein